VGNEHEATANSRSGEGGEVACRRGDAPAQSNLIISKLSK
jgi:hypothetical protein